MKYDIPRIRRDMLSWWRNEDLGRPIVRIFGADAPIAWPEAPPDAQSQHTDPEYRLRVVRAMYDGLDFFGEAFLNLDLNLGPGSMATYLGSEPVFRPDTIWFTETAHASLRDLGDLRFDPDNRWWRYHLDRVARAAALCEGTPFVPTIPDILENVDVLSLLRGPQSLCYDLIDAPELVREYVERVDDLYFRYYEPMYELVREPDGGCSYTAFSLLAPARCAKVQCDFAALMSPAQFAEFVVPSLAKQCARIPYTLYHLDGPDAIRHVDAVLSVPGLCALNWVPGAGQPDGGDARWVPLYDKVVDAGKSLWISMDQGGIDRFLERSRALVNRYGTRGLYLHYATLPTADARRLYEASLRGFR